MLSDFPIVLILCFSKRDIATRASFLNTSGGGISDSEFFEKDLKLETDQVIGFLEYIDSQMKTSGLLKQTKQFELIDYLINKSREYKSVLDQ